MRDRRRRFHSADYVYLPTQPVGWRCHSHPLYQIENDLPNSQNHLKRNAAILVRDMGRRRESRRRISMLRAQLDV